MRRTVLAMMLITFLYSVTLVVFYRLCRLRRLLLLARFGSGAMPLPNLADAALNERGKAPMTTRKRTRTMSAYAIGQSDLQFPLEHGRIIVQTRQSDSSVY